MLTPKQLGALALAGVVGAGVGVWLRPPPWSSPARTIPTGAGFTVAVAQLPSEPQARTIAARVAAAGLPAFSRRNTKSYQVIAGPYISLDEADDAQRFLAKRGFKARVLVDESVRRAPGYDGAPVISRAASVVLIAGAGSVAVVIELAAEPRHVATNTVNARELEIVAGPVSAAVEPMRWNAPRGVSFLRYVSIDEAAHGQTRSLRARIAMPPAVQATVRTSGRRIYVDLARPATLPEAQELPTTTVLAAGPQPVVDNYRDTIEPLMERMETIEPFVMSAVAEPANDVLAALERSLRALDSWAEGVTPPGRWRKSHDYVVGALRAATEAVSAGFSGDRAGKAREAFALRDAAKESLEFSEELQGAKYPR